MICEACDQPTPDNRCACQNCGTHSDSCNRVMTGYCPDGEIDPDHEAELSALASSTGWNNF